VHGHCGIAGLGRKRAHAGVFRRRFAVAALQTRFGGEVKAADLRDWVAFAREHLQPMEIGERIFVVPEWRTTRHRRGGFALR